MEQDRSVKDPEPAEVWVLVAMKTHRVVEKARDVAEVKAKAEAKARDVAEGRIKVVAPAVAGTSKTAFQTRAERSSNMPRGDGTGAPLTALMTCGSRHPSRSKAPCEVHTVKQAVNFERVLLSHVEMCYSVALALTRNPDRAKALARYALTWAWRRCESPDDQKDIKRKLLKVLREWFLQYCCHTPCSLRNEAALAERIQYVLPNLQSGISSEFHAVFGL